MDYTIRHVKAVVLTDRKGREIRAERIGSGRYCEAYRDGKTVYILAKQNDVGKEILEGIGAYGPEGRHIPCCDLIGSVGERRLYSMSYIRTLTAKDAEPWRQFRLLEREMEAARLLVTNGPLDVYEGHTTAWLMIEAVAGRVPDSLLGALKVLIDAASNYGASVWFEFAKRNLGVDNGNLVLRDVMFDMEEVLASCR